MSVDLRSTYLGFTLKSPIVASAGPLTGRLADLEAIEEAGAGAVVLPSLFEEHLVGEQLEIDRLYESATDLGPEAAGVFFPIREPGSAELERHLGLVTTARERLAIPVIASLNGTTPGGWVRWARRLVEAGAEALELNVYDLPTDPDVSGHEVEARQLELVAQVRDEVGVPLAVKIGPWYSSIAHMARSFVAAGADGLVLFNRFYQPDIDLDLMDVRPHLVLSTSTEARLPLLWIGLLYGTLGASLAATTGVHQSVDVVKLLLAGADVVMTTSSLLRHGIGHVKTLEAGLRGWMVEHEYESVAQMRGSLSRHCAPSPDAYERANYLRTLQSWSAVRV